MRLIISLCLLSFVALGSFARSPSPAGVVLYIISPADGDTIQGPITIRFGLSKMGVAPAGIQAANTGHHHLLIDTSVPTLDKPIPNDANHRHFGKGQTETSLELTPGNHTLQLLLGDFTHIPHDPPVLSKQITITVE